MAFALLETLDSCCVCQSPRIEARYAPDLWRCAACQVFFRNPRPTQAEILRSYDSGLTYATWQDQSDQRARLWKKRLELVLRFQQGGDLLDVGTGDGFFLDFAREHFSLTSTEPSRKGAEYARRRGHDPTMGSLEGLSAPPGGYQVITLWHVLEHLPFPGLALRQVKQLLGPEGVLVLAVPNEAPGLLKSWLMPWRHPFGPLLWGAEIHLVHFTARSLSALLRSTGFVIEEVGVDDVRINRNLLALSRYHLSRLVSRWTGLQLDLAMYFVCRHRR